MQGHVFQNDYDNPVAVEAVDAMVAFVRKVRNASRESYEACAIYPPIITVVCSRWFDRRFPGQVLYLRSVLVFKRLCVTRVCGRPICCGPCGW